MKDYRLYDVVAGGLTNTRNTFDSIQECDDFFFEMKKRHDKKPSWKTRAYIENQLVLMHYSGKYKAKIVKIYEDV